MPADEEDMGRASELFWLIALWRLERAAERFYGQALELCPRGLRTALTACQRSHEWRALYLWDWLRRLGVTDEIKEVPTHLYGIAPGKALHDATLLLWTIHEGEDRGRCMYERLTTNVSGSAQAMVLQYLDPEQSRIATITEALLTRRLQATHEEHTGALGQ
ncbi:MAG TPA: hypothetical protein VFB62_09135, partial [Polyangiaceae bacterium]|nr:hypothetical protein [Polyangiaceae bacterium]